MRYPFLWNAAIQDQTQWPGFADNGNDDPGARPQSRRGLRGVRDLPSAERRLRILGVNYSTTTRPTSTGLAAGEAGPQARAAAMAVGGDEALAAQGKAIYERPTAQGGCTECHGISQGRGEVPRRSGPGRRRCWTSAPTPGNTTFSAGPPGRGALEGAQSRSSPPARPTDAAFNMLSTSVLGSILQPTCRSRRPLTTPSRTRSSCRRSSQDLRAAFGRPDLTPARSWRRPQPPHTSTRRASWRASGPRRPTCTTARSRPWPSC